ncbi:hypothetical protein PpBr36_04752 [Pyricularia pennisetigena]|uniref:hypothetical protein n=1 Tax=Pyricularia pennisetigena TaxID=1578925 RepID=UPI0011505628|nr:hypothetical protein PpBr36_04752 [Pyricularia pennisetigena]TLS27223.1 hypothetical protein PpBr36_04752 [Pyricularia pennisetigena]
MRFSFIATAAAAVAVQAAPGVIEARDDAAAATPAIPAPCVPTPGLDTVALYDKVFAFQKAYLFDKNYNETFKYYSADFQNIWRRGTQSRDQYWATDNVQRWNGVVVFPTDASFKDGKFHVAYDMGENRTGHAGDDFVWKDGCVVSQQQTSS